MRSFFPEDGWPQAVVDLVDHVEIIKRNRIRISLCPRNDDEKVARQIREFIKKGNIYESADVSEFDVWVTAEMKNPIKSVAAQMKSLIRQIREF